MVSRIILIQWVFVACLMPPVSGGQGTRSTREPIYRVDGRGMERVEQALAEAKKDNKRVLLKIGGNWCGWCYKLHDLFEENAEIRRILQEEYLLVPIESAADKAVIEKWEIRPNGYPYLTVLGADGKKRVDQDTGSLEKGPRHDPDKVLAFLKQWKAPPLDARIVLKEAQAQASERKIRLFVHFSTPWCGWCRQLESLLGQKEMTAVFDKQYIDVRIDLQRMTHAEDVQTRIAPKHGAGVPWYAVLDAKGMTLATSDGPRGNTGYPVSDEEIGHFMKMIALTGKDLKPADITCIESLVRKRAEEILKKRKQ